MEQNEIIKSAQYRKGLSISYFNSVNAAIEIIKLLPKKKTIDKRAFEKWRDYFLNEHTKYYGEVIANIGTNYKASDSIAKLKKAKTLDELKSVWISFSEDERRDGEIIAETKRLKVNFLKQNEKA